MNIRSSKVNITKFLMNITLRSLLMMTVTDVEKI